MINTLGVGEARGVGTLATGSLSTAILFAGVCASALTAQGKLDLYPFEVEGLATAASSASGALQTGITFAASVVAQGSAQGYILGSYLDFAGDGSGRMTDGEVFAVSGADFGDVPGVVRLNGIVQTIVSWTATQILFIVDSDGVGQFGLTIEKAA